MVIFMLCESHLNNNFLKTLLDEQKNNHFPGVGRWTDWQPTVCTGTAPCRAQGGHARAGNGLASWRSYEGGAAEGLCPLPTPHSQLTSNVPSWLEPVVDSLGKWRVMGLTQPRREQREFPGCDSHENPFTGMEQDRSLDKSISIKKSTSHRGPWRWSFPLDSLGRISN